MENKIQAASTTPLVTYQLDGEISKSLNDFFNGLGPIDKVPSGDFHQMKKVGNQVYAMIKEKLPAFADVKREDLEMKAGDGSNIFLRWYSPGAQAAKGPAVVFIHGGGRMYGSVDLYDHTVAEYVHHSNVPFLSVEYGLTPDTYGKAQAEQALDAVLWLKENAVQFGVDVNRIAIMGDSGGGGIAADERFSTPVLVAQLELLLRQLNRLYHYQFRPNERTVNDFLSVVENELQRYFNPRDKTMRPLLTVSYLADRLHLTPHHLSDKLKDLTGSSALQHIHYKMVEKAKDLISTTSLSMSGIAYLLGFEHPQSFSKVFKSRTGLSPTLYKQSLNNHNLI
jgi:AraC-like DNA-binding protein